MKKQFTCRINTTSYDFLESFSNEMGIKHPAYENVPNISKSLDIVISILIEIKNNNINGCNWDAIRERVQNGEG